MFRVLVLIGAILFFRVVLPRTSPRSPTAITPYMNALDGMMSAEQVSSVLDEVTPYESWLASRRTKANRDVQHDQHSPRLTESQEQTISVAQESPANLIRHR